jgi:putative pyrroloquinoline-quinone binding quinoprotein
VDDRTLIDGLRSLPAPDAAGAQARARRLVVAAHAVHRPRRRRRRWVVAAIACAVVAGAPLTAVQGAAVARWARDTLRGGSRPSGPPAVLGALPGGGRLLVSTGADAWIVGQGLTRPVAHTAGGAVSWSAFGNYVACACGDRLQAIALNGRVAWTEQYRAPVRTPVWSPDGQRIAFSVGNELYVTAADGTRAHGLRPVRGASATLTAWRPGLPHQVAVADGPGRLAVIDADDGRAIATISIARDPLGVAWSSNGNRLLVVAAQQIRVYSPNGQLIAEVAAPTGAMFTAAQIAPSGRQLAYLISQPDGRQRVVLRSVAGPAASHVLLVGASLGDLRFSPDGHWLLVGWHELDSWLFFTTAAGTNQVRQITGVSARLGRGEPVVDGWCCEPQPTAGAANSGADPGAR